MLDYVRSLYENSKDGLQHSLAKFILQKEGQELPVTKPLSGSDWYEMPEGITLAKVSFFDNSKFEDEEFYTEFMVSSSMITVGQFLQFVNDKDYSQQRPKQIIRVEGKPWDAKVCDWKFAPCVSPTADHPAVWVSPVMAARFCNWLSEKHGLSKVYDLSRACDEINPSFAVIPDRNGFRLPTEDEISQMRYGGLDIEFQLGSDIRNEWIMNYASFTESLPKKLLRRFEFETFPVCVNLPTQFGLFDIFGGVRDICVDNHRAGIPAVTCYGRGFGDNVSDLFHNEGLLVPVRPQTQEFGMGFRVAIDKPPSSK